MSEGSRGAAGDANGGEEVGKQGCPEVRVALPDRVEDGVGAGG